MTSRPLIAVALAFWLAIGPLAAAWAQQADTPCESMAMSMPADDCCGGVDQEVKCLSACLAAAPAIAADASHAPATATHPAALAGSEARHASILAPPDIAPPKASLS